MLRKTENRNLKLYITEVLFKSLHILSDCKVKSLLETSITDSSLISRSVYIQSIALYFAEFCLYKLRTLVGHKISYFV